MILNLKDKKSKIDNKKESKKDLKEKSNNIDYLHNKDIIIGDVKNKNILVDNNNNPIFVDVDSMGINKFPQDHIDRGPAGHDQLCQHVFRGTGGAP